ncbi:MAG: stage II sporulation protein E [Desulfovibrionales bacterium]|nr:MAG: stage II sporulation protein E [Desulfovibrionales bacterium]
MRLVLIHRLVDPLPPLERSRRQFRIELSLLVGVGLTIAVFNLVFMDFPLVRSGLKVVLGFLAFGLFQSLDMTLERERQVIGQAKHLGFGHAPPAMLFPLTRRFLYLTILLTFLVSAILILVIIHDLRWLSASAMGQDDISMLVRAVIIEILFVMVVMMALVINLILSYTKNLSLLLDNQTSVLERASKGDLSDYVPAVTNDELGFIAGHTNQMLEGLREHLRITRGLEVAREIQTTLLPAASPAVPGLDIAGKNIPCEAITGDYFDYFHTRDGEHLAVLVGDVSGHGVGSALIMASVRSLIRLRVTLPGSLAECMADVNRMMTRDTFGSGRFMTLFCLVIDTRSFQLHWSGAGHDPAIVYSPTTDKFTELPGIGLPLGIRETSRYAVASRNRLEPGAIILLGTDGIWETMDDQGRFFGKDRLRATIRKHAAGSAQDLLDAITRDVAAFRGEHSQEDDVTMVVVKMADHPNSADSAFTATRN